MTCSPSGPTVSQCRPTNLRPSETIMSLTSRRRSAGSWVASCMRVNGAISMPSQPALLMERHASANSVWPYNSLQTESLNRKSSATRPLYSNRFGQVDSRTRPFNGAPTKTASERRCPQFSLRYRVAIVGLYLLTLEMRCIRDIGHETAARSVVCAGIAIFC